MTVVIGDDDLYQAVPVFPNRLLLAMMSGAAIITDRSYRSSVKCRLVFCCENFLVL